MKKIDSEPCPSWNSGRAMGQKKEFEMSEVKTLSRHFIDTQNWHDLALISLAIDSMLRGEDLLALRVEDVRYSNGQIRDHLGRQQQKTKRGVFPALTIATKVHVALWIKVSGKKAHHALFTRTKEINTSSICRSRYADIVKDWAEFLGHPPDDYSTHSLRRTKPIHLFWKAEKRGKGEQMLVILSKLLGHKSINATVEYLGITQKRATEVTLNCTMVEQYNPKKDGKAVPWKNHNSPKN